MNYITKQSRIMVYASTGLWCIIMLIISALLHFQVNISTHFSYQVLLEFTKAIALWYIISIVCSCITDLRFKKSK